MYKDLEDQYGTVEGEEGGRPASSVQDNNGSCSSAVDTRYLRSIEGILRLVTILFAIVGIVVTTTALYFGPSGWYYFAGIGYISYALVTIILETFVPNVYINRIADAVITGLFAFTWLLTAIINTAFAATIANIPLGVASIFAYISSGLCIAQVVLTSLTWRHNGGLSGPSRPVCGK